VAVNCEENVTPNWWWGGWMGLARPGVSEQLGVVGVAAVVQAAANGQAGSMARFALDRNFPICRQPE
jgi:hypothetical protein